MRYVVDRFEGEYAVLVDLQSCKHKIVELAVLPQGTREGSVVIEQDQTFAIDEDTERSRSERIRRLMDSVWE